MRGFSLPSLTWISLVFTVLLLLSCGTGQKRILTGATIGGAIGATGGFGLSPNQESRGINALVFGLAGATIGAISGAITDTTPANVNDKNTLKDRDSTHMDDDKLYELGTSKELPEFLKSRVKPILIEEYTHQDSVDEDGTLHEPHKVYRIKRNGELYSLPGKAKGSKK